MVRADENGSLGTPGPGSPGRASTVASGAERASGERVRRRRRTTPLLADLEAPPEIDLRTSGGSSQPVAGGLATDLTVAVRNGSGARGSGTRTPAVDGGGTGRGRTRGGAEGGPAGADGAGTRARRNGTARRSGAGGGVTGTAGTGQGGLPDARTRRKKAPAPPGGDLKVVHAPASTGPEDAGPASTGPASTGPASTGPASTGPASTRPGRPPRRAVQRSAGKAAAGDGREHLATVVSLAEKAGEDLADVLTGPTSPPPAGSSGLEEQVAAVLGFLRRRLTGDYAVDDFGFDPELADTVFYALTRPLYRRWFRVEVRGIENIPDSGGALVVANHSGAVALDAVMTALAVHDEHPRHRFLRALGADLVFQTPFVGEIARKSGATLASNADAERLLSAGELVGVWPEGFKGIGKPFSERYKLQRFGRGGFVSAALRTRTPIVPCSIVGAEETYPIIGNLPTLARLLGLPYMPVTPTWPLLGPLGLLPLPSKWLIEFGPQLATDELGTAAADDPMLVFDLTDQVRQTIQQTLYSLLVQRRSVFF